MRNTLCNSKVHQPSLLGAACIKAFASQHHVKGKLRADKLGQAFHAAPSRQNSQHHLGQAKLGAWMVHSNAVAAGQRELEPTAQADTPYEGQGGIGHFGKTVKQMPASGNKALNLLCTVKVFELFNVGARNKAA